MVNISLAQSAAKSAVEYNYTGVCDIIEYSYSQKNSAGISNKTESVAFSDIPCRISFQHSNNSRLNITVSGDTSASVKQFIKLFISPDICIKPGSKIIITQNGVTNAYKNSGQPSVYSTHQEIMLELFDSLA